MMELRIGGNLQNGKYEIVKTLGSGSFGITYLASMQVEETGPLGQMNATISVAIKEYYMSGMNNRSREGNGIEGSSCSYFSHSDDSTLWLTM